MVKRIIRVFVIETVALYLTSQWVHGLVFAKGAQSLLLTGVALALASLIIRPLINIFLLPINLVTFNLFRFVSFAITLFLVDLALAEFSVTSFSFIGLNTDYFDLPKLFLEQGPIAYLAFSIVIASIAGVIHWLMDK